ncbi:30S ribosomal protein S5 [Candidatus Mycoplasma haematobovis]|uniref:Small ribosomal subunit protein uS5 n=1 Tax=Candidatus Mycoplasma haematobovis TaxID=432608 RepID=A0A1A9QFA4_9MOLU|nr:30S ribosomal protein S5 [Candidatus Mycoplasma haematobovis]OAL10380.1 30S ribosomal protein S5 [Candidatus Mycoplasma haematobovis]
MNVIISGDPSLTEKKPTAKKPQKFFRKTYKSEYEEKIVKAKRVSKTTKGGRQSRAWVLVVIGNKKGKIGYGIGKSKEFQSAVRKAVKNANKNLVKVSMNEKGTVFHEYLGKHGASKVLIKPAKQGTGIIAGGAIKTILELAGYTDIYSKNLGSNTSMNMIRATVEALKNQRSPAYIAKLRDKTFEDLFHI